MGRSFHLVVLLGISAAALTACVPIKLDPARDQFGVSTARPDAGATAGPTGPELAELDRKAQQICTTGYQGQPPTVLPAQNEQQIVDQQLRCGHYDRLDFDYVHHIDWSNIL